MRCGGNATHRLPSGAEWSRAEQGGAKQSKVEQSRAEQGKSLGVEPRPRGPRLAHALRRATGVLEASPYGRALDDLFDDPFVLLRRTDLDRATDAFDALLGLVAVDLLSRPSPYAKVFSIPGHAGEIVGLADAWLWERWRSAARERLSELGDSQQGSSRRHTRCPL